MGRLTVEKLSKDRSQTTNSTTASNHLCMTSTAPVEEDVTEKLSRIEQKLRCRCLNNNRHNA